jgi:hypothetical protein
MHAKIQTLKKYDSQYSDLQKTRKAMEQRIWGICARFHGSKPDGSLDRKGVDELKKQVIKGDGPLLLRSMCEVFMQCLNLLSEQEKDTKKNMEKLAKDFEIYEWVKMQRGAGLFNLARIIANANTDLNDYPGPANLWARFGLGVTDGKADKPKKGEQLTYSPARRAIIHNLGECLVKGNGYWKKVYDQRKEFEVQRQPDMTKIHAHRRAMRYMEKKFLEAMWQEWTGNERDMNLAA